MVQPATLPPTAPALKSSAHSASSGEDGVGRNSLMKTVASQQSLGAHAPAHGSPARLGLMAPIGNAQAVAPKLVPAPSVSSQKPGFVEPLVLGTASVP